MKRQQSSSSGDRKRDGTKSRQHQQQSGTSDPSPRREPRQQSDIGNRDVEREMTPDDENMDRP